MEPNLDFVFTYDPRSLEARDLETMKKRFPNVVPLKCRGEAVEGEARYLYESLKIDLEFLGEDAMKVLLGVVLPAQREQFALPNRKFTVMEREQLIDTGILVVNSAPEGGSRVLAIRDSARLIIPNSCGMRGTKKDGFRLSLHSPIKTVV